MTASLSLLAAMGQPATAAENEPGDVWVMGDQSPMNYPQYDSSRRLGDGKTKFTSVGYYLPLTTQVSKTGYVLATDADHNLWPYPLEYPSWAPSHNANWTQCAAGYEKAVSGGAITTSGVFVPRPCNPPSTSNRTTTTTGETIHLTDISYVDDNQSSFLGYFAASDDGRLFAKWPAQWYQTYDQWEEIPLPPGVDGVRSVNFTHYYRDSELASYTAVSKDGTRTIQGDYVAGEQRDALRVTTNATPLAYIRTATQMGGSGGNDVKIALDGSTQFYGMEWEDFPIQPLRQFEGDHTNGFTAYVLTGTPDGTPSADSTPPVINGANDKTISVGGQFDPKQGVTATDDTDGDLIDRIRIEGSVDVNTPGRYELTYSVTDEAGNTATEKRAITIVESGTAIACAPQTGADPAASLWQAATMLMGGLAIGFSMLIIHMQRKLRRRI